MKRLFAVFLVGLLLTGVVRPETRDVKSQSVTNEIQKPEPTISAEVRGAEHKPTPRPAAVLPKGAIVELTRQTAIRYGVPSGIFLAQINQESGFNPRAVSPTGDYGCAQLNLSAQRVTAEQAFDCPWALNRAGQIMQSNFNYYGNWRDALAAYNAGRGGASRGLGYSYADKILRASLGWN